MSCGATFGRCHSRVSGEIERSTASIAYIWTISCLRSILHRILRTKSNSGGLFVCIKYVAVEYMRIYSEMSSTERLLKMWVIDMTWEVKDMRLMGF